MHPVLYIISPAVILYTPFDTLCTTLYHHHHHHYTITTTTTTPPNDHVAMNEKSFELWSMVMANNIEGRYTNAPPLLLLLPLSYSPFTHLTHTLPPPPLTPPCLLSLSPLSHSPPSHTRIPTLSHTLSPSLSFPHSLITHETPPTFFCSKKNGPLCAPRTPSPSLPHSLTPHSLIPILSLPTDFLLLKEKWTPLCMLPPPLNIISTLVFPWDIYFRSRQVGHQQTQGHQHHQCADQDLLSICGTVSDVVIVLLTVPLCAAMEIVLVNIEVWKLSIPRQNALIVSVISVVLFPLWYTLFFVSILQIVWQNRDKMTRYSPHSKRVIYSEGGFLLLTSHIYPFKADTPTPH